MFAGDSKGDTVSVASPHGTIPVTVTVAPKPIVETASYRVRGLPRRFFPACGSRTEPIPRAASITSCCL